MNNGFITLHRRILDWQWYEDANVVRVFLHLLLNANHKDKKWKGTTIKRGQLATSYDSIAVKLGLTARQVRTSVVKLKNSGECVTRRSGLFLLVTIVKYDDYQNNRVEEVTRSVASKSRESHEDVTRMSINNNVNNDNNVNNIRSTDIKVLKDAYVKNERLVKAISLNYEMDLSLVLKRLEDFNRYLEVNGKFEMDENEYIRYFRNFIKKGKENNFNKFGYKAKNHKDVAY